MLDEYSRQCCQEQIGQGVESPLKVPIIRLNIRGLTHCIELHGFAGSPDDVEIGAALAIEHYDGGDVDLIAGMSTQRSKEECCL